jgi:phosphomannomutase
MTRARRKQLEAEKKLVPKEVTEEPEQQVKIPDDIYKALQTKSMLQKEIRDRFQFNAVVGIDVEDDHWVFIVRSPHKPLFKYYQGYKVYWLPAHGIGFGQGAQVG